MGDDAASAIEATRAIRLTRVKTRENPTLEDTRFTVALSSITLFGEALLGSGALEAAGLAATERLAGAFARGLRSCSKIASSSPEHPTRDDQLGLRRLVGSGSVAVSAR